MLNVLVAGVGGQGSVLAAKVLAQAASAKGWHVRTAETMGMAQRGGTVTSHVRMGNQGEEVHAPLVAPGLADCVIALEPGEGLRALPYVASDGLLVCAKTGIPSVADSLGGGVYDTQAMLAYMDAQVRHFACIDDAAVIQEAGSPKVVNIALLAAAVLTSCAERCGLQDAIGIDELQDALRACIKPRLLDVNEKAIDAVRAQLCMG